MWLHQPSADELLRDRLQRGWKPTPTRLRDGERVLGHAACAVTDTLDTDCRSQAMQLTITEESPTRLAEYSSVPIRFQATATFDDQAIAALLQGAPATATPLATPTWKDYDAYPGNHPTDWATRLDVSRWTILAAFTEERRVGGAVVIHADPQIELLDDCPTCALLWDIRVAPELRRQGIGAALLRAVEDGAIGRGATALRVETQQINVPACRFYARHGFRLERANPGAYRELPHEIQLLWRKELFPSSSAPSV